MSERSGHNNPGGNTAGITRREVDLFDLAAFAWSSKVLIAVVFAALFIPMAVGAWVFIKPSYEAQSRLLVLLDAEDPTPGAAGSGGAFMLDQMLESETQILNSNTVRRLALERLGRTPEASEMRALRTGFKADRAPNASVLVAHYRARDAQESSRVLNALVDAYLDYRQDLLVEDAAGGLSQRLASAEASAEEAENALRAFLNGQGIIDFPAEREAAIGRVTDLQTRLLTAQAEASAARGGAAALEQRLTAMPRSIELYVENDSSGQLLSLQMRRRELLARYQADAPPVQAIEREIEAVQDFLTSGGADGAGQRRTGVNPVYQDLDAARLQYEATAVSQAELAAALQVQLAEARAESDRLRGLTARHNQLSREASARGETAARLSGQTASAAARTGSAAGGADAVRIVERATPPTEARSMRIPAIAAAAILALGAAILAGLLTGYVRTFKPDTFRRLTQPRPEPELDTPAPRPAIARPANEQLPAPTFASGSLKVLARVRQVPAPRRRARGGAGLQVAQ